MATSNETPENLVLDGRRSLLRHPLSDPANSHHTQPATMISQAQIDQLSSNANPSASLPPPIIYGELSILGYNGHIPNVEKSGRRNRSKYLLCQRSTPNGIKKTKRYYVKQPQATKAIQDKDLHSISYTFSRSQTIIVEYGHDQETDMFQIGRSSEEPIDFVVVDTFPDTLDTHNVSNHHHQHHQAHPSHNRHHYNENNSSGSQMITSDSQGMNRVHRHLAKVGDELIRHGMPLPAHDPRAHQHLHFHRHHPQAVLLNYPQPNMSNLPPVMADHFRIHDQSYYHQQQQQQQQMMMMQHHHHAAHSSGLHPVQSSARDASHNQPEAYPGSRQNQIYKRPHATQSTISRFACRIIVDRKPPHTARIFAAGFDSSKNIFLGEKATKWEQNDSIDGLTTNGVLLMHPKRGSFYSDSDVSNREISSKLRALDSERNIKSSDASDNSPGKQFCTNNELRRSLHEVSNAVASNNNSDSEHPKWDSHDKMEVDRTNEFDGSDTNGRSDTPPNKNTSGTEYEEVWREVSVDGGIYAIRESRSAAQKGTRIKTESNILQDGTLIDLCGATLLWRSVDGFRASPTKKSLEDKVDQLNASRPQCPVGLNTLVIPRKPIPPGNQHHRHGHRDHHTMKPDKSHQPYVYLKCGHVQGYHDWGTTEILNQRTCPICMSVGTVAKLSMGLEPSFYVDSGPLTHVFNPCGHMASERTVKYWCSIKIPHGTHFFHSICPFCATPLTTNELGSTKLIFQDDLD